MITAACKKLGFVWKQMINDEGTGSRTIHYGYKRPHGIKAPIIERQEDPIVVKCLTIVGEKKLEVQYDSLHSTQKGKLNTGDSSLFCLEEFVEDRHFLVDAMRNHINDLDEKCTELTNEDFKKKYNDIIVTLQEKNMEYPGMKAQTFGDIKDMQAFIKENTKVDELAIIGE